MWHSVTGRCRNSPAWWPRGRWARRSGARSQPRVAAREVDPGWGIDTLDPAKDSPALVIWDSASDPIPLEATPPSTGRDPHGDPRSDVEARRQKAAFLFDGELIDTITPN